MHRFVVSQVNNIYGKKRMMLALVVLRCQLPLYSSLLTASFDQETIPQPQRHRIKQVENGGGASVRLP